MSGENEGREVFARSGVLTVYRTGLARGVEGESYLTWQIEVGNGSDIREFVFVDAHSGKVVDRLPGIMDAMFRRAYDGLFLPGGSAELSGLARSGSEGQLPFPTGIAEADNMMTASRGNLRLLLRGLRPRLLRRRGRDHGLDLQPRILAAPTLPGTARSSRSATA